MVCLILCNLSLSTVYCFSNKLTNKHLQVPYGSSILSLTVYSICTSFVHHFTQTTNKWESWRDKGGKWELRFSYFFTAKNVFGSLELGIAYKTGMGYGQKRGREMKFQSHLGQEIGFKLPNLQYPLQYCSGKCMEVYKILTTLRSGWNLHAHWS